MRDLERQKEKERKEEEKLRRKELLEIEWSKREKQDFFRALCTYGIYRQENGSMNWDIIKEKASLKRKTPEMIEERYIELLKQCKQVIQDHEAQLSAQDKLQTEYTDSPMQIEQQKAIDTSSNTTTVNTTSLTQTKIHTTHTPSIALTPTIITTSSPSSKTAPSTKQEETISYINAKKTIAENRANF